MTLYTTAALYRVLSSKKGFYCRLNLDGPINTCIEICWLANKGILFSFILRGNNYWILSSKKGILLSSKTWRTNQHIYWDLLAPKREFYFHLYYEGLIFIYGICCPRKGFCCLYKLEGSINTCTEYWCPKGKSVFFYTMRD